MGFKISDLVTGLGAFMIVMGVTLVLFLTPAVYWSAVVANERETERGPQAEPATGRAAPQV
jgi:hypothetical protein